MTPQQTTVDPDLIATVSQFFVGRSGHAAVAQAEVSGLPLDFWSETEELGLPLVGIEEEFGGSGGSLFDALAILRIAGANAVPLPLAENHLAAWLLSNAGLEIPSGPLTIAPGTDRDTLRLSAGRVTGEAHDVPWARGSSTIVAIVETGQGEAVVVAIPTSASTITGGADLAGQPRNVVAVVDLEVEHSPSPITRSTFLLRGALLRAAQIAGALEAVSDLTRRYVGERVQFGRPIGSFQAVQQHIAALAQLSVMTSLSVDRAARAATRGTASLEICSTKLVANENAALAARAAHQAHGAIGMTREYRLQQLTRRLNGWRREFGTDQELAARIGAAIADSDSFARVITGADNSVEV